MSDRDIMIIEQLKQRNIKNLQVLKAMSVIPREAFVSQEQQQLAYADNPLSIGYGQTISQPFIVAFMTEAAQLQPNTKVLEIGTGCGYQAAVLSQICEQVYSIEVIEELAKEASKRLKNLGYNNIYIRQGDGYEGWPEEAPFDAIIVTAAPEYIPQNLIQQLKIGGRLIIPIGKLFQELLCITRNKDSITEEALIPVRFVPMVHDK